MIVCYVWAGRAGGRAGGWVGGRSGVHADEYRLSIDHTGQPSLGFFPTFALLITLAAYGPAAILFSYTRLVEGSLETTQTKIKPFFFI